MNKFLGVLKPLLGRLKKLEVLREEIAECEQEHSRLMWQVSNVFMLLYPLSCKRELLLDVVDDRGNVNRSIYVSDGLVSKSRYAGRGYVISGIPDILRVLNGVEDKAVKLVSRKKREKFSVCIELMKKLQFEPVVFLAGEVNPFVWDEKKLCRKSGVLRVENGCIFIEDYVFIGNVRYYIDEILAVSQHYAEVEGLYQKVIEEWKSRVKIAREVLDGMKKVLAVEVVVKGL